MVGCVSILSPSLAALLLCRALHHLIQLTIDGDSVSMATAARHNSSVAAHHTLVAATIDERRFAFVFFQVKNKINLAT